MTQSRPFPSSLWIVALVLWLNPVPVLAAEPEPASVEFTHMPAPASDAELISTYSTSRAVVRYRDGSVREFPLAYNTLFKNTDRLGEFPAGQLFDVQGKPIQDPNGDPVIAETPDGTSLLSVDGNLFLVTHFEYDWILGNGAEAYRVPGWYSRMPMSMSLAALRQEPGGRLRATSVRPIDFSGVNGLWIPCAGGPSPWNTHLGSEEDYDLYFQVVSGEKNRKKATEGLRALREVYFRGEREVNPYDYGYIPEVTVQADGSTSVVKHYSMGRATWELARVMGDNRTAYYGDDGDHVALFMYVADQPEQLTAGTLYAARWNQVSSENGGSATLDWIRLGHASDAQVKAIIDSGVTFEDIFDATTATATPDWQTQGYRRIRAGHSGDELLRLKPGRELAAAFLESRRYAAYRGATTEFNKMEGVTVDPQKRNLYLAMSYLEKGFLAEPDASQDHIHIEKLTAGATYEVTLAAGRYDTEGNPIRSEWVGTAMRVPFALLGEDIPVDALGNVAHPEKIANPDNLFFSPRMRTLFIGEDSGTHVNNFLWAYNVDTGKRSRILSNASGAESTGLQVVDNLNGFGYIISNNQHQGDWISTMPEVLRDRLIKLAMETGGVNHQGTLNLQLDAHIGYLGGLPGF